MSAIRFSSLRSFVTASLFLSVATGSNAIAAEPITRGATSQLLQKLSSVEFNLSQLMSGVQNGIVCSDDSARLFAGEKCESMKSGDVSGLRATWGLEATGADLMRLHPAVRMTDTRNSQLAIIDTGLELRGNPSADAKLQAASPELEYGSSGHGTHVAGIIASEKFGVNPGLNLKVMPTFEASADFNWQGGFDGQQVVANIRKAADDPSVKVINMSISNPSDKENAAAIRYAMSKGKWIVNAAGNEGQIASAEAAGLVAFTNEPRFFTIGSLSPFGAPAGHSNYGPTVRYFAPGAMISSLNAAYNPNLGGALARANQESTIMSGTSMASPHFAGVLATLAAIQPKLSAEDANLLIARTSLKRGPKGDFAQVNSYLAVTLLDLAKDCLAKAPPNSASSRACFDSAEKKLASQVKVRAAEVLAKPISSPRTCGEFNREFGELRQLYFLSKGDPAIAERISTLLDSAGLMTDFAKLYFAPNSTEAIVTTLGFGDLKDRSDARGLSFALREDQKRAVAFHQGKEIAKEQTSQQFGPLQNLHPSLANVPAFLKTCSYAFSGPAASRRQRSGGDELSHCSRFLHEAPAEFNLAVVKEIAKSKVALQNDSMMAVVFRSGIDRKDPLAVSILTQMAQGFIGNPSKVDTLGHFFNGIPAPFLSLSARDRKFLLEDTEAAYKTGALTEEGIGRDSFRDPTEAAVQWQKQVLSSVTKARLFRPDAKISDPALGQILGPNDRPDHKFDPEVRTFVVASLRAGVTDGSEAAQSFTRLLATAARGVKSKVDDYEVTTYPNGVIDEYGDYRFNSSSVLQTFHSKVGREVVLQAMSTPEKLSKLQNFARVDLLMKEMLPTLSSAEKQRLMKSYLEVLHSKSARFSRGNALEGMTDDPDVKAYLQRVKDGKASSESERQERTNMLRSEARQAEQMNPYVRAFIQEQNGEIEENVFSVHPTVVIAQPELKEKLVQQLQRSKTDPELTEALAGGVRSVSRGVVRSYLELLHPDVARLSVSGGSSDIDSSWLAQAIMTEGKDSAKMGAYAAQLAQLSPSLDELKKKAPGAATRDGDLYGNRIVHAVQMLGAAKTGDAALAGQPKLISHVADFIADPSLAKEPILSRSQVVPRPLAIELAKRMPDRLPVDGNEARMPPWMILMIESSPEGYQKGLEYFEQASKGDLAEVKSDLSYALKHYQERNRKLKPDSSAR